MGVSGEPASLLQLLGAGGFGAIVGWYLYFINRHRTGEVKLGDLVSVVAAIGGAGVLAIFPSGSDLFGAYGIGLFVGFFGYLLVLAVLVRRSPQFDVAYFIDGRRRALEADERLPSGTDYGAMGSDDGRSHVRG